jgi:hypothetical protein
MMTERQWVFLIDPEWRPASGPAETPPAAAVVGGWLVAEDGDVGAFNANPDYEPATANSPTDPLDAALRMSADGQVDTDALFAVLRASVVGVALDDDEQPIIAPAPDDVPSLLVTTAATHRKRVDAAGWLDASLEDLARLLAEHQVDVLVNPGAPTSTRLLGSVVADAARG